MLALLLTVMVTAGSLAQGNRRGGDRGNGGWKERDERRNDVAMERGNKGDWKRNDENRNRNYDPGNTNRGRNDEWRNNRGNDQWNSRRGNDNPGNRGNEQWNNRQRNENRGNSDWGRERRGDNDMARRNDGYRRNMYTRDRPGSRPVYNYDRRPVYNRYDPCWRYSYLPRRNSYFYSVPASYFSISFGGFSYRYWDGVFYRPYNNLFTVCAPPVGISINILPAGCSRIYVRNYPYYYYNGTYYDQRGSNYYVVSPPVGAVVESIPDGYETVVIDGETYYVVDGAQYKPVIVENGEIWYEVIKAN